MTFDPKQFEDDAWGDPKIGPTLVVLLIVFFLGALAACFVYGWGPG